MYFTGLNANAIVDEVSQEPDAEVKPEGQESSQILPGSVCMQTWLM